jgi:hypothetical protein
VKLLTERLGGVLHGNGTQQNHSKREKNTKDTVLIKVLQGTLSHIRAKPNKITALTA